MPLSDVREEGRNALLADRVVQGGRSPHEPDFELDIVVHALRDMLAGAEGAALNRLTRVRRTARKHVYSFARDLVLDPP